MHDLQRETHHRFYIPQLNDDLQQYPIRQRHAGPSLPRVEQVVEHSSLSQTSSPRKATKLKQGKTF